MSLEKIAIKSPVKRLRKLRREYRESLRGYRVNLYSVLGRAFLIANGLAGDEKAQKEFCEATGVRIPSERPGQAVAPLTVAVIAFVSGARSPAAEKLAWKRARALEFLYAGKEFEINKVAVDIKRAGGIESLARKAASQKSQVKRSPKPNAKAGAPAKGTEAAPSFASVDDWCEDPSDDMGRELKISVPDKHRRKVLAMDVGQRVRLIGKRADITSSGADLKIVNIVIAGTPE